MQRRRIKMECSWGTNGATIQKMFYYEAHDEDEFAKKCCLFWPEYKGFLGKSDVSGDH